MMFKVGQRAGNRDKVHITQIWCGRVAVGAGVAGLLSVQPIGSTLQAMLLVLFIFAGFGSAILCWYELPPAATVAGVVGLSLCGVIILATAQTWLHLWNPTVACVVGSAVVMGVGGLRLWAV